MKKKIIEELKDTTTSRKIIFAGYISPTSEMLSFYDACDVFILPLISEKEGFGIVQSEAMTRCKPVICPDLLEINEVGFKLWDLYQS